MRNTIILTLSALLLKQHYLADVLAGATLAFFVHRFTLGRYARQCRPDFDDVRSRGVLYALAGLQIAAFVALWIVFRVRS